MLQYTQQFCTSNLLKQLSNSFWGSSLWEDRRAKLPVCTLKKIYSEATVLPGVPVHQEANLRIEALKHQAYQSLPGGSKGNSCYYLFTPQFHSYISPTFQDFYQTPAKAGNTSRNAPQRQKSFCNYFTCYSSELEFNFQERTNSVLAWWKHKSWTQHTMYLSFNNNHNNSKEKTDYWRRTSRQKQKGTPD